MKNFLGIHTKSNKTNKCSGINNSINYNHTIIVVVFVIIVIIINIIITIINYITLITHISIHELALIWIYASNMFKYVKICHI